MKIYRDGGEPLHEIMKAASSKQGATLLVPDLQRLLAPIQNWAGSIFGRRQHRFRGLVKNTAHVITLFPLSDLWMARR